MADDTQPPARSDDCLACRGTGQVISGLGGEPRLVPCPWCEGSGVRLAGHDAQAHWRESVAPGTAAAGAAAGAQPSA